MPEPTNHYLDGVRCAEQLIGTIGSIEDYEDEYDTDHKEVLVGLDETAFCCDICGWWCETIEAHEGPNDADVCGDCSDGKYEDDE